jgi:hypothetical protein
MSLQDVTILLGTQDARVDVIYSKTEQRLLSRLKRSLPELTAVPNDLDYIVDEVAIARFNRIGSEGMASESMDGHSATYDSSDFNAFERDIVDYINAHAPDVKKGKVRFL